jgi:hypothetical protein
VKKLLAKLANDTGGNVLLIFAVGGTALVGGAGLGVDTVQWYLWQRQLQQAVDAGALAGGLAKYQGQNYTAAATDALNDNANTQVTIDRISDPPKTGAYAGKTDAIEVVAQTQRELPFTSLFLKVAPVISARAVASTIRGSEHCVISLAKDGVGVDVAGNANVTLGCGVAANSTGSQAIDVQGTSWLQSNPLSSVGGIAYSPSNVPSGTTVLPYTVPFNDPMASRNLQVPTSPSACTATALTVTPQQNVTLSPGRYCGGLAIKGTATLSPGVYIIDGGSFDVASQASVYGPGVTFVLTGSDPTSIATANISGGAKLNVRAPTPTEDPYWHDVLLFQDPTADETSNTLAGGSGLEFNGIVYMPNADITFAGNSGQQSNCLLMVSYRVTFTGTSAIGNNCPSSMDNLQLTDTRIRVVE